MTTLPALRAPLPVLVDEVLNVTATLHPDEALQRLGPLWAASKPGIAQRALLAARIALMRKAMTVAPLVVALPEPEPEPVPEPVFVPAPLPKVTPLNRGALRLMNLEDAARMLMVVDDPADAPSDTAAPRVDTGLTDAAADLAEVIASEAKVAKEKAKKPKAKRAEGAVAKAAPLDLAAQFADMADDAPVAKPAPLDLAAQFADMDWDVEPAPSKPPKKAKAAGLAIDLSAQFAALGEDQP